MSKEAMTLALDVLLVHEYELRKVGQSFKVEPAIKVLEEALKYDMDTGRMVELLGVSG